MNRKGLVDWINQAETQFRHWMNNKSNQIIEECTACGTCTAACRGLKTLPQSVRSVPPNEIKEALLKILRTRQVQPTPGVLAALDFINGCGECEECRLVCPQDLNPVEHIRIVKNIVFESGITPPDYVLQADRMVPRPYATGEICFQTAVESIQWTPEERSRLGLVTPENIPENPEPKEIVVMASCFASVMPDCLVASLDVFKALGIPCVTFSPIDYCCGYPDCNQGNIRGLLEKNLLLAYDAARYKPKQLVIGCPTCYEVYHTMLSKTKIVEYPFEIRESVQLFAENIETLKSKFKRSIDRVITIQDSCHLGRCSGEFDAQRKVLQAIPGVKMVEMKHSREEAICCACQDFIFDDRGWQQRSEIFEEAKEAGADAIMTICHMCNRTLSTLEDEYGIEVINLNTLLGQALGHDYDKKFHRYIKMDPDEVLKTAKREIAMSPFGKETTESLVKEYITRWGTCRYRKYRNGVV